MESKIYKKYVPQTIEQELTLKDGRVIFKTHNGFRSFMRTGFDTIAISDTYYNKVKRLKVT